MRKTTNNSIPLEHQEQVDLFRWAELMQWRYPELFYLYAVPNGGKRHLVVAAKMKQEGVKRGVPDICLAVPKNGYHGLYIELKRLKGGRIEPEQKDWIEGLRQNGYRVEVCKGWGKAKDLICEYLGIRDEQ